MSYGRNRSLPPGASAVLRELREFPTSSYGRMYVPKSEYTSSYMGASASAANEQQRQNRAAYKYRGVGAYSIGRNWRKFSQGVGLTKAGRTIVQGGANAVVNMMQGASKMIGQGAYTTNSLMTDGGISDQVPMVSSGRDETGAIYITKREYVCDVFAPETQTAFSNTTYPINPGMESTFPWLAQIAQNYEEYDLLQCLFTFRSTITDIGSSTTGQCGTIIMTTNYNSSAGAFTDKAAMMEYAGAMSCKSTESMIHGVECDPSKLTDPGGYVRTGPVAVYQDAKTYDHGVLNLAVANMPAGYAGQSLGELWVSYTVKLKTPKFYGARGYAIQRDIFVCGDGTSAPSINAVMGVAAGLLTGQQNSINCSLDLTIANTIGIKFPSQYAGYTCIKLRLERLTSTASPTNSISFTGNVRSVRDMYAATGSDSARVPNYFCASGGVITNAAYMLELHVFITPQTSATPNQVFFTYSNITTAPIQSVLEISEYNAGYSTKALNIGPPGGQSEAPILVSEAGGVTTPV